MIGALTEVPDSLLRSKRFIWTGHGVILSNQAYLWVVQGLASKEAGRFGLWEQ